MVTDTRTPRSGRRPELARSTRIPSYANGRGGSEGKLRPLNSPRPLEVETGAGEKSPVAVYLSGHRCAVESVVETWRIDDEWWRERPVSRVYWRLFLENGCTVDVYRDGVSGRWYKQAYTG